MGSWVLEARVTSGPALVMQSSGLEIVEGTLGMDPRAVLEKLETFGVNYWRHRELKKDPGDFRVLLTEDVTTTTDLYERETEYAQFVGEVCTLTVAIRAIPVRWFSTTIESIGMVDRAGPLNGFGSKSGSRHTLRSIWNFRRNKAGEIG